MKSFAFDKDHRLVESSRVRVDCYVCRAEQRTWVQWQHPNIIYQLARKVLPFLPSNKKRLDHFCSLCYIKLGTWSPLTREYFIAPHIDKVPGPQRYQPAVSGRNRDDIYKSPLGPFPDVADASTHIELLVPLLQTTLTVEQQHEGKIVVASRDSYPRTTSTHPGYSITGSIKSAVSGQVATGNSLTLHRGDTTKGGRAVGEIEVFKKDECGAKVHSMSSVTPYISRTPGRVPTENGWLFWDDKNLVDVYGRTCTSFRQTWDTDNKVHIKYSTALEVEPRMLDQLILLTLAKAIIDICDPRKEHAEPRSYYSSRKVLGAKRAAALERKRAVVFERVRAAALAAEPEEGFAEFKPYKKPPPNTVSTSYFKSQNIGGARHRYQVGGGAVGGGEHTGGSSYDNGPGEVYNGGGSYYDSGGGGDSSGGGDGGGGGGGGGDW